MSEYIFKDALCKIFTKVCGYSERNDVYGRSVSFSVLGQDITFDNLQKVSDLLGTKNINVSAQDDGRCRTDHGGGYCYCGNTTEIEIFCWGVKFPGNK